MASIADLFNPATVSGSIAINIVGGVGAVLLLGFPAWLGGGGRTFTLLDSQPCLLLHCPDIVTAQLESQMHGANPN
jgi:hypothetical protein